MLFGRAQEEIDALGAAGVVFEVVPGITAALAASAQIGVSLTRRGLSRNVAFVTTRVGVTEHGSDWAASVIGADTAAIYMGAGQAAMISTTLTSRGLAGTTPVAILENVSLPQACVRYGTLDGLVELAAVAGDGPVVILLGEILREQLDAQLALARDKRLASA
jgi:uroporphyrin-III C-methyltransferase